MQPYALVKIFCLADVDLVVLGIVQSVNDVGGMHEGELRYLRQPAERTEECPTAFDRRSGQKSSGWGLV